MSHGGLADLLRLALVEKSFPWRIPSWAAVEVPPPPYRSWQHHLCRPEQWHGSRVSRWGPRRLDTGKWPRCPFSDFMFAPRTGRTRIRHARRMGLAKLAAKSRG